MDAGGFAYHSVYPSAYPCLSPVISIIPLWTMYLCRSSWFLSFCSCSPNHFWRRRRGSIGPKVGNGNVSAPGPSSFREIRIVFQLQAPPALLIVQPAARLRSAARRRRLGNGGALEPARRLLIVQLIVQLIPGLIRAYLPSHTVYRNAWRC